MTKRRILIIIPAFNEAKVIREVLSTIPNVKTLNEEKFIVEKIVINDGSTDSTLQEALSVENTIAVDHIMNTGAGGATRTGLQYAKNGAYDFAATMDSDGQHKIEDVFSILEGTIADKADLVVGSRLVDTDGMPWYKVLGNLGLSIFTSLLFGTNVRDTQSGLKAFNATAIQSIYFHSNGYTFCSEMLWRAKQANLRVVELPISAIYTEYSMSKGQSNWNAFIILGQLLKRKVMGIIS